MLTDHLVYIIDLNEIEGDNRTTISLDFTVNFGTRVWPEGYVVPKIGEQVRVHSDDDKTLYWATVVEKKSDRDYVVAIEWESCEPVLNDEWSATDYPRGVSAPATSLAITS